MGESIIVAAITLIVAALMGYYLMLMCKDRIALVKHRPFIMFAFAAGGLYQYYQNFALLDVASHVGWILMTLLCIAVGVVEIYKLRKAAQK